MRYGSLLAFANVALTSVAQAKISFANASPLLISSPYLTIDETHYIAKEDDTNKEIQMLTGDVCSYSSDPYILYLQIHGLDNSDDIENASKSLKYPFKVFSNNVVYSQINKEAPISSVCQSIKKIDANGLSAKQLIDALSSSDTVKVVDIYNKNSKDLTDLLSAIFESDSVPSSIFVQGLPVLKSEKKKRDNDDDDEVDYEKVEQDLKNSFSEAYAQLNGDEEAHVYETAKATKKSSKTFGSLLDNYAFFSSGIWMAIIVSGFLLGVLYVAFKWLNSIQISYSAFDKPVNTNKKAQ